MTAGDSLPASSEGPLPPPGPGEGRGLLANSTALVASRLVVAALGWGGMVLIAQRLSLAEFGRFSFVFGLLGLMSIITGFGIGRVVLAALVRDERDTLDFAGAYVGLRIVLGLMGYSLAMAVVLLGGYPDSVVRATAVAGMVVVIATPSRALDALFQARMRLAAVAVADVMGQTAQLGCTVAIAFWRPSLIWFTVPFVVNDVIGLFWKASRLGVLRPRPRVDWALWRVMLVDAVPLAIGTALSTLYYKVDLVMLSRLDTFESVGVYAIGYKFADVVVLLAVAVLTPTATMLVRAWPDDVDEFRAVCRRVATLFAVAAVFLAIQFVVLAETAIGLLYGEKYVKGADAARLVVTGATIHIFVLLGYTSMVSAGKQRVYPLVTLAGLALNVSLNLVLIPAMSYQGAALATLLTEVVVLCAMWWAVTRTTGVRGLVPMRPVLGTLGSGGVALGAGLATELVAPWPVVAAAVALVFLGGLQISGVLGEVKQLKLSRRAGTATEGDPGAG
ncbi:MAG TPA: flippase [Acidimicrobiales bacterium]|nr:flippase [Acidimicrobiales bacterium]